MRYSKLSLLLAIAPLYWYTGCDTQQNIPTGYWQSVHGRPSLALKKDSAGNYRAIIYHRTADGYICPVAYPVIKNTNGIYIQAEGRIFICYSFKDSTLFLSPGGTFRLTNDTLNNKRLK